VKTWWLSNEETMDLRSENDWTIDLQPHTVTAVQDWYHFGRPPHSTGGSRKKTENYVKSPDKDE
jgi:hypothetical protein